MAGITYINILLNKNKIAHIELKLLVYEYKNK